MQAGQPIQTSQWTRDTAPPTNCSIRRRQDLPRPFRKAERRLFLLHMAVARPPAVPFCLKKAEKCAIQVERSRVPHPCHNDRRPDSLEYEKEDGAQIRR